jgi:hypothetical protein
VPVTASQVRTAPPPRSRGGGGFAAARRCASRIAPAGAEDLCGDAVELDTGVLQGLVQPVGLALALGDLRLPVMSGRAPAPLRLGGTKLPRSSPASIS